MSTSGEFKNFPKYFAIETLAGFLKRREPVFAGSAFAPTFDQTVQLFRYKEDALAAIRAFRACCPKVKAFATAQVVSFHAGVLSEESEKEEE